jgi:mono/diheme cytochrome c family protein
MKPGTRIAPRWSFALLAACLLVAGCKRGAARPAQDQRSILQRGQYLVDSVAMCKDCHTPRNPDGSFDASRYLAGVECLVDVDPAPGKGCLNTRNLTPDRTGLKNRTDAQIEDMFLKGVTPTGRALNPIMPYWSYHNMTAADADAVVAWIRSVPAVAHAVPESEAPWISPPRPAAPIDPATIPMPPESDAGAVRGRYLAAMAGLCLECHTPQLPPGGIRPIDMSRPFAGGRDFAGISPSPPFPPHIYSRNLTQDATGLAGWTAAEVVKALKHGLDRQGHGICPPMPSGPKGGYGGLTDEDATDIASYVLTLPAIANPIPNECVAPH